MKEDCIKDVMESAINSCDTVQKEGNEEVYNSNNDATIIDLKSDTLLVATPKTELRYPAQITKKNILQMSPKSLIKAACILKDAYKKK